MIHTVQPLLNSNSKNMNVNGTVPKTFSYTASSTAAITGFIVVFKDEGSTSYNKFGAITSLTNGVVLQATINSVTTTIATIKDNADLCTTFHYNQFGSGAVLSILGIVTAEGFGNSTNSFIGYLEFPNLGLQLQSGDSVSVIIQDDLSNIDSFQISCKTAMDQ